MWSKSQLKILPLTYLITVLAIVLLTAFLKNKSLRIKTVPLAVTAIIMIAAEIIKISLSVITKQFTAWQIPLHYCSLLMLWFFLSCFSPKKTRHIFYALSVSMGMPVALIFLVYPNSMLRDSADFLFAGAGFLDYHNFFYHILIVFFIGLVLSLKLYKPKVKDLKYVLLCFYIWALAATISSNIFNENYAGLLHSDFSLIDKIRIEFGYFFYLFFLYAAGLVIITGVFLTAVLINNFFNAKKKTAAKALYTQKF